MNRNRMLIGLTVAVVVGLFLSTYVYRAFKNASAVNPTPLSAILPLLEYLPPHTKSTNPVEAITILLASTTAGHVLVGSSMRSSTPARRDTGCRGFDLRH